MKSDWRDYSEPASLLSKFPLSTGISLCKVVYKQSKNTSMGSVASTKGKCGRWLATLTM